MGIIGWIVLGLIVGALAKLVMPGDDKGGIILTMLLGVVGALVGGFLGRVLFNTDLGTFWDIRTWLLALDDAHPSCPELLIEFPHLVAVSTLADAGACGAGFGACVGCRACIGCRRPGL